MSQFKFILFLALGLLLTFFPAKATKSIELNESMATKFSRGNTKMNLNEEKSKENIRTFSI